MFVYTGRLIFKSYKPLRLDKGMLFLVRQNKEMVIIQLDKIPFDMDECIRDYGYPVDPYIIAEGNPNLDEDYILVYPHQIGWWDEGEHSDDLYDITVKEINQILDNDCFVDVEVEEDDIYGRPVPVFIHDKAILSHNIPEEWEEWEQDYSPNNNEDDQD